MASYLSIDTDGVVHGMAQGGDDEHPLMTPVSDAVYAQVLACAGRAQVVGETVSAYTPPRPGLAVLRADKAAGVNARRDALLSDGFTPSDGPLAGKTLQTRDADDKLNWVTSQAAYSAAVAAGQGDAPVVKFRSADNTTIVVTISEGLAALLAMAAWGQSIMDRSWALKDAIAAAADQAALDAIDITAGWPA